MVGPKEMFMGCSFGETKEAKSGRPGSSCCLPACGGQAGRDSPRKVKASHSAQPSQSGVAFLRKERAQVAYLWMPRTTAAGDKIFPSHLDLRMLLVTSNSSRIMADIYRPQCIWHLPCDRIYPHTTPGGDYPMPSVSCVSEAHDRSVPYFTGKEFPWKELYQARLGETWTYPSCWNGVRLWGSMGWDECILRVNGYEWGSEGGRCWMEFIPHTHRQLTCWSLYPRCDYVWR